MIINVTELIFFFRMGAKGAASPLGPLRGEVPTLVPEETADGENKEGDELHKEQQIKKEEVRIGNPL